MTPARLSLCYAAPGLHLLESAGPTRNVLSVAEALSEWADVTVAFRRVQDAVPDRTFQIVSIDRPAPAGSDAEDDNGARGLRPVSHVAYCRTIKRFAEAHAPRFDVVLEKGWRLSGIVANAFQRAGVPAVVVENDVRLWTEPIDGVRQLGKVLLHHAAERVATRCCRRLPAVIAETEQLKELLVARRGLSPDRVHVVGLGVDHERFRPMDQSEARRALGISSSALVLLYVGGLDEYHDLEPIIDALSNFAAQDLELHVIGGGTLRERCEARAIRGRVRSRFYGPVRHDDVPRYIAAADLCLSPYRADAFHGAVVTFSTLKVPEYMACARPVAIVPCAAAARLVDDGTSGFVVANTAGAWRELLARLPSRERLAEMGQAARTAVEPITWRRTASAYLDICGAVAANVKGHRPEITGSPAAAVR